MEPDMKVSPGETTGVGIEDEQSEARTELLDYLAKDGLRSVLMTAARLRTIAAEHPTEYLDLPARVFSLQQLAAYIEAGLQEAGYGQDDVRRLSTSEIRPVPHDPSKPRTNR